MIAETKKVFISQPMKNKPNKEIMEQRQIIINELERKGYKVLDAVFKEEPPEENKLYYMAKSIEFMGKSDIVYFMKGWEYTRGCRIEHTIAVEFGKKIMYQN